MTKAKETIREGLILLSLERMKSSVNGNPRYRVTFTDGTSAPTQPDAMLAYGISNSGYRDTPLRVMFNGRGHITYMVRMDGKPT